MKSVDKIRSPMFHLMGCFSIALTTFLFINTRSAHAKTISLVETGSYAISSSILQGIMAKEICSCVFVSKVGGESAPISTRAEKCLVRSQLPLSPELLGLLLNQTIDPKTSTLEVTPKLLGAVLGLFQGREAVARYEGEKVGCRLLTDQERAELR